MRSLGRYFVIMASVMLLGSPLCQVNADGADLTGTLIVRVRGLTSGEGNLRFVLFDSKKNFLKHPVCAEVLKSGTNLARGPSRSYLMGHMRSLYTTTSI
jgi:uncharacterized protein (DUF2141 family)